MQNDENYWPSDVTSCPRRPESSLGRVPGFAETPAVGHQNPTRILF